MRHAVKETGQAEFGWAVGWEYGIGGGMGVQQAAVK